MLIPGLSDHLTTKMEHVKPVLETPGPSFDYLLNEKRGEYLLMLGHREESGALIPNPNVIIRRVTPSEETAEALLFNDDIVACPEDQNDPTAKKERHCVLNEYLRGWLSDALMRGYRIELSQKERNRVIHKDNDNNERGMER